jgi:ketosteroid isomerase-like protein
MASNADAQSNAREMLDRFFHFVATRDLQVLAEFAPGDDVLLIGSDAGEVATGAQEIGAFFTRLFASARTFSWEAHRIDGSAAGDIAWFFADGQMTVESADGQKKLPYRIGGVLERIGDRWCWRQYHGSEPVANN